MSPGAVCHRADYIAWKGQRWEPVNPIVEVLGWGSTHYLQFDWVQGVLVGVHNWGAGSKRWCDGESGIMLGHTTIHFLQAMGGSMPAEARLQFRQACYAGRLAGSESAEIRDITVGDGELAQRLRSTLVGSEELCPVRVDTVVERTFTPRGLRFPGLVEVPRPTSDEEEKEQHRDRARDFANSFMETEHTFWTDGSAYPDGVAAGAVVTHLVDQDMSDDDPLTAPRVSIERRGIVDSRLRGRDSGKRLKRGRTYKESRRSFVKLRCEGGLVAEA